MILSQGMFENHLLAKQNHSLIFRTTFAPSCTTNAANFHYHGERATGADDTSLSRRGIFLPLPPPANEASSRTQVWKCAPISQLRVNANFFLLPRLSDGAG